MTAAWLAAANKEGLDPKNAEEVRSFLNRSIQDPITALFRKVATGIDVDICGYINPQTTLRGL